MSGRGSVYRRGNTWTAHVKLTHHGKSRQLKRGGFRTEREAQQHLTKMLAQTDRGIVVPPDRLTVDGWLSAWLEHLEHVVGRNRSTVHGYRMMLRRYLTPIGAQRLQNVTARDFNRIYAEMAQRGLAAGTIRQLHVVARRAFADAVDADLLVTNVVDRAKPPSFTTTRAPQFPTWTFDELASFLEYVDGDRLGTPITFAALTGCRRGEVVGLRWADVDFEGRTVTIAHTITDVGGTLVEGDPKSHRSRPISLDDDLDVMLRRHRAAQNAWRLKVGPGWIGRDLVFPGPDGDFLRPGTLSQRFDHLVGRAGVRRIRFHDLRHTHATLLVESGRDAKTVSERLGHATVAFTLDRYVKASLQSQLDAANDFARRLRLARKPR